MRLLLLFFFISVPLMLHGQSDLVVTGTEGHAWSEQSGWWMGCSASEPVASTLPDPSIVGSADGEGAIGCAVDAAVVVTQTPATNGYLRGFFWSDAIGWVSLSSGSMGPHLNETAIDWGVNLDAGGRLSGFAWSESAGWVNFDPEPGVTIDLRDGAWRGYAWSESLGWVRFQNVDLPYFVQTHWPRTDRGLSHAWLYRLAPGRVDFDVLELEDTDGDAVANWKEYVARTDALDAESFLAIRSIQPLEDGPGVLLLRWEGQQDLVYQVREAAGDLEDGFGGPLFERLALETGPVSAVVTGQTEQAAYALDVKR